MPYLSCPNCRLTASTAAVMEDEECPRCSSRLGEQAARFAKELPGQATASNRGAAASLRAPDEGLVLLAEDEHSVRELTRRVLSRHGHEVLVADSAGEALRVFASDPLTIDLLLTDVVMPEMSGCELAERIRRLRPELPILYMSGDPAGIIDPYDALPPRTSFLAKPFEPETLSAAVQDALGWQTA